MDGTDKELRELKFVDELKRVASGVARNGRPSAKNDQLLAQSALTSRIARAKGAGSLFSLINALFAEAMLGDHLSVTTAAMERQAEVDFFSTTLSDIVTGQLIIREPLNMLRCNAIPEIQALPLLTTPSRSDQEFYVARALTSRTRCAVRLVA